MIILAIETSCDETAAAVLRGQPGRIKGSLGRMELLANIVLSQIAIHAPFGGVVPEVAARHHVENILPVVAEALKVAKVTPRQIDAIAVTAGPGLITSLIVGVTAARALSMAWGKPLIAVNHMYAHIAVNFIQSVQFPAVCLVVSGGHTELVVLKDYWHYHKIGQTVDDAVGEAFDKVAKILDLGYPGGPIVSKYAGAYLDNNQSPRNNNQKNTKTLPLSSRAKADASSAEAEGSLIFELRDSSTRSAKAWNSVGMTNFNFPRPMLKSPDFNFSYSGLKTAVLYAVKKMRRPLSEATKAEICYEFQNAALEGLVVKTMRAAQKYKVKSVLLAGGVAANKKLRGDLQAAAEAAGYQFFVPEFSLCTDNAAMIAVAGYAQALPKKPKLDGYKNIAANANWEL